MTCGTGTSGTAGERLAWRLTTAQADRDIPLLWAVTVAAAVLGLIAYAIPGLLAAFAERRGLTGELTEES